MAPATFAHVEGMSAVVAQPAPGTAEREAALQALLACPTYSIHISERADGELSAARDSFPLPVPPLRDVFHCGFHAAASYGATSYFIRRAGGNVLVDTPRWNPSLAKRLEALGGVAFVFLSHRDDVSDHARWAEHFPGCTRIIHSTEVNRRQGTDAVEWKLEGAGPWALGDDCQLLSTPGHTAGCVSLLYSPDRALFTGDTLAWSNSLQRMTMFRAYNWHSVSQQLASVAALRGHDFLAVLPGHGRRRVFADAAQREAELQQLLEAEGFAAAGT